MTYAEELQQRLRESESEARQLRERCEAAEAEVARLRAEQAGLIEDYQAVCKLASERYVENEKLRDEAEQTLARVSAVAGKGEA